MRVAPLALGLVLVVAPIARAATIDAIGDPGLDGANALDPNPATAGGPGGDAVATATGPEASNQATATGGVGGNGGKPAAGTATSIGGAGGNGGAAQASANAVSASGGATASALAHGGTGGTGGGDSNPYVEGGVGGDAGSASADAQAQSSAGPADAQAQATSGSAGSGGYYYTYVGGLGDPYRLTQASSGHSADADAHANATSGGGDASASAWAGGHSPDATSQAFSATGAAHSYATAAGENVVANGDAPADGATANAFAHAAGAAAAIALAHGNTSNGAYAGAGASATARAESETGPATARATQISGNAPPSIPPAYFGYPPGGGGPGVDSIMQDAVSGSSAGMLSLYQEAVASSAANNFKGGDASSVLHATNPGGGALAAEAVARAGGTGLSCISRGSSPICDYGAAGAALAEVDATGAAGQDVDARAHSYGGPGVIIQPGGYSTIVGVGAASATANAQGTGNLFARADATTDFGALAHAAANAVGAGSIQSASARLDLLNGTAPYTNDPDTNTFATAGADAGIGAATTVTGLPTLASAGGDGRVFAAPRAADVAAALAGNPNSLAAASSGEALALASLDGRTGAFVSYGTGQPYTLSLDGSISVAFSNPTLADESITLAFLDPTAVGDGVDQLVLEIALDGHAPLSLSFDDTASAVSALDDALYALGKLGPGESASLVLTWNLTLLQGVDPTSFALDLAVLSSTVPEPGIAVLAALVGLGLCVRRRAG